ncbi:MAG: UTP--glucose-1-phosphate uridylyltransferase [Acidimicrobiia bacterium]
MGKVSKHYSVCKAVIPAAGLGTRFLPATKAQPKEMLPIVDKPAIQYVVEEAIESGIDDIIIITGRGKRTLEDHFDRSFELEHYLERSGKEDLLKEIRAISEIGDIHYIRQKDPLGLGHAVLVAQSHVAGNPFAVLLGDDICAAGAALLKKMMDAFERYGRSVIAVMEVPIEEIEAYGVIEPELVDDQLFEVKSIVEKPSREEAPSNLAVIGRYIFTPEIFDALSRIEPGKGGEIQLTDGIAKLLEEQTVYAYLYEGTRYDIGKKEDWIRATVELALEREDLSGKVAEVLSSLARKKKLI